jgi:mRNA interferase MazF
MKQAEIWYADLNPVEGNEQAGFRPVLILSGNLLNTHAPVLICCPLTTKLKRYKGNVVIEPDALNGLTEPSEILTFHIRSIAKSRLKRKIGMVQKSVINEIKIGLNDLLNY